MRAVIASGLRTFAMRRGARPGRAECGPVRGRSRRARTPTTHPTPRRARARRARAHDTCRGPDSCRRSAWRGPLDLRGPGRARPPGWKNSALSIPRHAPRICQSQMSVTGPGAGECPPVGAENRVTASHQPLRGQSTSQSLYEALSPVGMIHFCGSPTRLSDARPGAELAGAAHRSDTARNDGENDLCYPGEIALSLGCDGPGPWPWQGRDVGPRRLSRGSGRRRRGAVDGEQVL